MLARAGGVRKRVRERVIGACEPDKESVNANRGHDADHELESEVRELERELANGRDVQEHREGLDRGP